MGHENDERGSSVAVVVVIVVLIGFFILLCVGAGVGMMLFGVRSATPIRQVQTVRTMPAPATLPPDVYASQPYLEPADPDSAYAGTGEIVATPVLLDKDGTLRIAGELVPLAQLKTHLDRTVDAADGQAYRLLDVKVAPDCPAAPLVEFLNQARRLKFCEVELSLADEPTDSPD